MTSNHNENTDKTPFKMKLLDIQPSQLYINKEKLKKIREKAENVGFDGLGTLPVKILENKIIFIDGHTRAFFLFLSGVKELLVYWDDPWGGSEYLDYDLYKIAVDWCLEEKINSIKDLENRVISDDDYEKLWYQRCEEAEKEMQKKNS